MTALPTLKGQHALVTGASGFIGRHLIGALLAQGARVSALVRRPGAAPPGAVDITVAGYLPDQVKLAAEQAAPDVVFHLGAYGVQRDERDTQQLITGNVGVTCALVEAVAARARRFIHVGSVAEYAPAAGEALISEATPLCTTSTYGAAKAAAHLCGTAHAHARGLDFVTLRLFGVYGPGEADDRFIPGLVRRLMRGEAPRLTPGRQRRDWVYVDDAVAALIAATSAPLTAGQAYNVCTGEGVEVADIAHAVAVALGTPDADVGLGRIPYRPDEPMWQVGDPARFFAASSWRPHTSLADGVGRAVAWAREQEVHR